MYLKHSVLLTDTEKETVQNLIIDFNIKILKNDKILRDFL